MSKINNPNDKLFKAAFQYPLLVSEFLKRFLSLSISESLDLKTLALDNTNYIDNALKEFFSDMVYSCKVGGKTITVILLFEHKTSIGHDIYIQLNSYILEILKQRSKISNQYEVIIPIVIYQGKAAFKKRPFHSYFKGIPEQFVQYIPSFNFELVSLQTIDDEELLSFSDESPLKGVLLSLKNSNNKDFIKEHFEDLIRFSELDNNWDNLFKQLIVYLYEKSGLKLKELNSLIYSQNNVIMKTKGMSAAQELRLEGKMEEKMEIVKEAWKNNIPADLCSTLTKLSLQEIKKFYSQFETEAKS